MVSQEHALHELSTAKQPSVNSESLELASEDARHTSNKGLALEGDSSTQETSGSPSKLQSPPQYRLYKRRWAGLAGLIVLNIVSAMQVIHSVTKDTLLVC
jgi:hypothetical protein